MKWIIVAPVVLVLALACSACQSSRQYRSTYDNAVSDLTKGRAESLKKSGCSIITVNTASGLVIAKGNTALRMPGDYTSALVGTPIALKTNESIFTREPKICSTVTAYLIPEKRSVAAVNYHPRTRRPSVERGGNSQSPVKPGASTDGSQEIPQ